MTPRTELPRTKRQLGGPVASFNLDLLWFPNATALTLHQQQDGESLPLKAQKPKSKRDARWEKQAHFTSVDKFTLRTLQLPGNSTWAT